MEAGVAIGKKVAVIRTSQDGVFGYSCDLDNLCFLYLDSIHFCLEHHSHRSPCLMSMF